jgi:hypothetical protein
MSIYVLFTVGAGLVDYLLGEGEHCVYMKIKRGMTDDPRLYTPRYLLFFLLITGLLLITLQETHLYNYLCEVTHTHTLPY